MTILLPLSTFLLVWAILVTVITYQRLVRNFFFTPEEWIIFPLFFALAAAGAMTFAQWLWRVAAALL